MSNGKVCGVCGIDKNFTQFHKSPINGTYLPICKNCCKKKFKDYAQQTGKNNAAMWLVCAELGIPFFSEIWKQVELSAVGASQNTDLVMAYLRTLNESGKIVEGFWQSDVMLDMIMEKTNVNRENSEDELDLDTQQKIWGKFLIDNNKIDIEAYEFLNQTYNEYTENIIDLDINLEKRYRDLAKCELRVRRANESGDGAEISKAQDSLNKQLSLLKMNDFSGNKKSEIDKHIERWIWTIENKKPAECEDLEKYKDFSGFGKTWSDITRSLRNLIAGTREYPDIPKGER